MAKAKTYALSLELSADGEQLLCFCKDYSIRLWRFRSGSLRRVYDESAEQVQEWQRGDDTRSKLDTIDYGGPPSLRTTRSVLCT
jgi:peptidylprolyl isomerase domain and WD repeat-containing protein 1